MRRPPRPLSRQAPSRTARRTSTPCPRSPRPAAPDAGLPPFWPCCWWRALRPIGLWFSEPARPLPPHSPRPVRPRTARHLRHLQHLQHLQPWRRRHHPSQPQRPNLNRRPHQSRPLRPRQAQRPHPRQSNPRPRTSPRPNPMPGRPLPAAGQRPRRNRRPSPHPNPLPRSSRSSRPPRQARLPCAAVARRHRCWPSPFASSRGRPPSGNARPTARTGTMKSRAANATIPSDGEPAGRGRGAQRTCSALP